MKNYHTFRRPLLSDVTPSKYNYTKNYTTTTTHYMDNLIMMSRSSESKYLNIMVSLYPKNVFLTHIIMSFSTPLTICGILEAMNRLLVLLQC
nr:MAG TPA: hypothetical protein [Bacteriophage sp.]